MTAYISRAVGSTQAVHIVEYMKRAGVPLRAVGSGSLMFGTPSHLAMLVELAMEDKRP